MSNETDPKTPATASERLYARLSRGPAIEKSLESTPKEAAPLDDTRVKQSIDFLKQALGRTKSRDVSRVELVDKVTNSAQTGLKKLADQGPAANLSGDELLGIEAVIHADGSRPVFFIRDGRIDRT